MMRVFLFLLTAFALVSGALAADISGNWKATAEGPNGSLERAFTFKVDGAKLTGETNSPFTGRSEIKDGKVDGESVSFSITANFQGNDVKINYTGKATSGSFKLISKFLGNDDFPEIEWTLTKAN
jgi:hypothetical protein